MKLRRFWSKGSLIEQYDSVLLELARVLGDGPVDPNLYQDADLYAEKYLAHSLTRKSLRDRNGSGVSSSERTEAALTAFLVRELKNRKFNETVTFGYDRSTGSFLPSDFYHSDCLLRAREIVHEIVGRLPVNRIIASATFGNGASATLVRADAQREKKYLHTFSATRALTDFTTKMVSRFPAWSDAISPKDTIYITATGAVSIPPGFIKTFSGGVFDTVEKTAKIKRVIIKECELNGYLQKGTGQVLRDRLRRYTGFTPEGVDLNTSGDLNADLARQGSMDGHIATVDAEDASNSLTLALYEFLFPEDWYKWFLMTRSPYVRLPNGKWHRCEMMSGMGNGFTFEAESIIFYALGCAASEWSNIPFAGRIVSIHGDDLTVPSDVFSLVCLLYRECGISVNGEKSFAHGPFRESCGGHFFNGCSVKPFYVKEQTGLARGDWFWLANSLHHWLSDRSSAYLSTRKGKDLIKLYREICWWSTNGNPEKWYTSAVHSRRAGVFADPQEKRKRRNVIDVAVKNTLPDWGVYLAWLQQPTRLPSVVDLCFHKRLSATSYEFDEETHERERWVTIHWWPPLKEQGLISLL